jgi:lipopolysaccharide/colanic/teichoic acid biosynthesis glycosyltransferase
MKRARQNKVMGIRATGARIEALEPLDETLHGTYWFDLRTRRPAAARIKRTIDIFGSLALIVLFAPLMLLIAALIRLTSAGPAMFVQRRIGFRCHEFGMCKFRTMVANAEELQEELSGESLFFKIKDDPRVTRLGVFLRRSSLDELPQLFNVLQGTMSLVGPRPLLVSDLDLLPMRAQMRRFSVRPGITGLWQVSGRSSTSDEERLRLDREYINNWSLRLDFAILLKTIGAVLSGRGAV